jgi:hypothetical protein
MKTINPPNKNTLWKKFQPIWVKIILTQHGTKQQVSQDRGIFLKVSTKYSRLLWHYSQKPTYGLSQWTIKRMCRECIMECYSAIKNKIISFVRKWMELEFIMLHKISQSQKEKFCMFCVILSFGKSLGTFVLKSTWKVNFGQTMKKYTLKCKLDIFI